MTTEGYFDERILQAIEEGDVNAVWPYVGRRMAPEVERALTDFVEAEISAANGDRLVQLLVLKGPNARRILHAHIEARLDDPARRAETVDAMRFFFQLGARRDEALRNVLIQHDVTTVEETRELTQGDSRALYRQRQLAIDALVRKGDHDWLLERVRSGQLAAIHVENLVMSAKSDRRLTKRLVDLASEIDSPALLAALLECHDLARPLVEKAWASADKAARVAALAQIGRLPNQRAVLESALTDPATEVRRTALSYLVDHPDPTLRPYVEALVDDPDPYDERYNEFPVGRLAVSILRDLDR